MITSTSLILIFCLGFIAALVSGAAGFGGALFLLPMLSNIIGIKLAVPVLTIGQLFGNGSRVFFGRKHLEWKPIFYFLITAIPLTILGSYLFTITNDKIIKLIVGILLFAIVVYRHLRKEVTVKNTKIMLIGGSLTGFISGIAGSAGPIGAAFFLSLKLSPSAYIASEAVTAFTMHIIKSIIYQKYSSIGSDALKIGLLIGLAMIFGSYFGKIIIEKLQKKYFIIIVESLLIISGFQMIIGILT